MLTRKKNKMNYKNGLLRTEAVFGKVEYLLQLSSTLCCEVECLIERVGAYED